MCWATRPVPSSSHRCPKYTVDFRYLPTIPSPFPKWTLILAKVYHVSNVLFVAWTLACAFAPNLGSLLVFRFFEGVAGVCALTIGSGTIADLIPGDKRGKYMSIYSLGPLLGPVIGPIAGAFLSEAEGWRWIFRVLTIAVSIFLCSSLDSS